MVDQECLEIAQDLINATAAMLRVNDPEQALPVMVRGLVEYGGWEIGEAERMAKKLIVIAERDVVNNFEGVLENGTNKI